MIPLLKVQVMLALKYLLPPYHSLKIIPVIPVFTEFVSLHKKGYRAGDCNPFPSEGMTYSRMCVSSNKYDMKCEPVLPEFEFKGLDLVGNTTTGNKAVTGPCFWGKSRQINEITCFCTPNY